MMLAMYARQAAYGEEAHLLAKFNFSPFQAYPSPFDKGRAEISIISPERPTPRNQVCDEQFKPYINLEPHGRIWAIGAIHGEIAPLRQLLTKLANRMQPGDAVVCLGNYFGYGTDGALVLEELLAFRSWCLSTPPLQTVNNFVFLRGQQEEMLLRLMNLYKRKDPANFLPWMEQHGMLSVLESFGLDWPLLQTAVRLGPNTLKSWCVSVQELIPKIPGLLPLLAQLKWGAYSPKARVVFTHAGYQAGKSLAQQNEEILLWGNRSKLPANEDSLSVAGFLDAEDSEPYRLIVHGFSPTKSGYSRKQGVVTVDGGAGRGGELVATLISASGVPLQWLTSGS